MVVECKMAVKGIIDLFVVVRRPRIFSPLIQDHSDEPHAVPSFTPSQMIT